MRLAMLVAVLALVATTCVAPSRTVNHGATEPLPAAVIGAIIGAGIGSAF